MSDEFLASLAPLTERVERVLWAQLSDVDDFPAKVGIYGLVSGGKRVRPILFCLACELLGRPTDEATIGLSTTFELLHLASLYHDDVIDMSDVRRGRPAAHKAFGIPEAVLAADYLLTKAAEISLSTQNIECFKVFIQVVKELSLGELGQLRDRGRADLSALEYERTIYRKTAALIEGVTLTAGLWLGAEPEKVKALGEYGRNLGLAFQIIDDVLDYEGEPGRLGKPVGQDLDEGRATLPFILARDRLADQDRERLVSLFVPSGLSAAAKEEIKGLVRKGGGLEAALEKALGLARQADEALAVFPRCEARANLERLAKSLIVRDK
ncbi:MAG: polyprenyl synthetase family protein [Deltaproteobacteria bacterium]|jgi:octaprenyl-diphosphate synthase|nr:polyprenyl synthetase family protein [Deltaproteobacteria bacterium]